MMSALERLLGRRGAKRYLEGVAGRPEEYIHWASVLQALAAGELDILASYLIQTEGKLDPSVAKYLVSLLRGTKEDTGFRLTLRKHPDLAPNAKARERLFDEWSLDWKMAMFIASRDGFARGKSKDAFFEASAEFGLSEVYIRRRVRRHKAAALEHQAAITRLVAARNP
jgi:hypothetical protein